MCNGFALSCKLKKNRLSCHKKGAGEKFSKTALFLALKRRMIWDIKEKESVHELNTYLTAIELNSLQFFIRTNKAATLIQ